MNENRGDTREKKAACRGQGALEKDGSISLTPRFSGVASGSRSFLTVSTVFHVFAGPFGTFLDAPCCSRQRRPCWLCHSSPPILTPRMRSAARPKSSQKKTTTVGVSQSLFQK